MSTRSNENVAELVAGPIRVLHVDDDPSVTELVAEYLERESERLSVETSTDPRVALDRIDTAPIDCVVTDYNMPEMDGLAFLSSIREVRPDLPVIVFSGEDIGAEALDAGADDFVGKDDLTDELPLLASRVVRAVDHRRVRQSLGATRRRFEDLTGEHPEAIVLVDLAGRTTYVTPAIERLLGYDPADLVGEDALDYVHPDDVDDLGFSPGEGAGAATEVRVRDADGEWTPILVRVHDRREDSAVRGVVVHARAAPRPDAPPPDGTDDSDGTDLSVVTRRVEDLHYWAARLQACSSRAEVYEETIDAAVDILAFDWCCLATAEEEFFHLRGVSEGALVEPGDAHLRIDEGHAGRAFAEGETIVVDDAHADDDSDPVDPSYRAGITVPIGDYGVFQAVSADPGAFDDHDRELAELLCLHVEEALGRVDRETALRERERELQRQNERLDRFASVVTHDLRNPLSVARAELDLARAGDGVDPESLDPIDAAHERMEGLIDDVLTFTRHGQTVDDVERVDLAHLSRECWHTVVTDGAALEVADAVEVDGDEGRLRELLENLYRNAVEHGSGDGTLTVRVGGLADGDGFYVEDDGPGIDPEDRDSVFESGYSSVEGNTGFGLAIVAEIVEAHGWTIEVGESSEGGARFEIRT